ncbi:MAG: hypothetical protein KDC46_01115 [Thermoleophilia bacterium]|nr:hypothetical protein [Thermoleophilia bacterium]
MVFVAHGIQGRADLPVPIQAFYWAAAIVLVVSFVGLAIGWRRPLLAALLERTARPWNPGRFARTALVVARAVSVALLLLVIATALFGSTDLNSNFAPIWVFVVWWIGIALVAATVGDWWRAVHPIAAIARLLRIPEHSTGRLPAAAGVWPAFIGLLAFTWLELVYPTAANVRQLGWLVLAWAIAALLATWRFGIRDTLDRIEPFAAYTRVLGHIGVLGERRADADSETDPSLERRPPVLGLLRLRDVPGLAPFIGLLIGSVSFDGLSRTIWWKQRVASATVRLVERGVEPIHAQRILGTLGLVMMVTLAISAFLLFARLAAIVGRLPRRTRFGSVAAAFAPSLAPIAFAYVIAHYFSFFWFQSQQVVRLASDPFGRGWNLFGTDSFQVDYTTLSANAIWIVQVVAIVVGHVLALVLAHDRALEIEADTPGARGVRSQWPMLALMVLYTIGGLYFLSEGLNS